MKCVVFNIQRFCLNDGPGVRTTVFLKGCMLNCLWCHNPESKSINPEIIYHENKCIGCSICVNICPTKNIEMKDKKAKGNDKCTMCYRCINRCPKKAITLLGKSVIEQTSIENHI